MSTPPAQPKRPEPQPLAVNNLRVVEVGIALWLLALVVTVSVPALHAGPRSWWPWTCASGVGLGFIAWAYVRRGRGNAGDA